MPLRHRALVVAEEPRTQRRLAVSLGGRGYLPLFARSADEAAAIARREHPRLVLVDMTMDGDQGLRALERFDDRSFAQTRVIALVGAGEASVEDLDADLTRALAS